MSHTVLIKTEFKEWNTLKAAFEKLGWRIAENQAIRSYSHDTTVYPFVAINPKLEAGTYDVGIRIEKEQIQLYGDFFGGSVAHTLGENFSMLKKEYALKVIEDEWLYQGASVTKTVNQNGTWTVEVEL